MPRGRCAPLQVLRAVTGEEYSIIPKVRVDWMILRVDAYSAGKKGGEKSGSQSPFATSDGDWLLQSKSPIRELLLILLTEEGAGRIKAR